MNNALYDNINNELYDNINNENNIKKILSTLDDLKVKCVCLILVFKMQNVCRNFSNFQIA